MDSTTVGVTWDIPECDQVPPSYYLVEFGQTDTLNSTAVFCHDTSIIWENLTPNTTYETCVRSCHGSNEECVRKGIKVCDDATTLPSSGKTSNNRPSWDSGVIVQINFNGFPTHLKYELSVLITGKFFHSCQSIYLTSYGGMLENKSCSVFFTPLHQDSGETVILINCNYYLCNILFLDKIMLWPTLGVLRYCKWDILLSVN